MRARDRDSNLVLIDGCAADANVIPIRAPMPTKSEREVTIRLTEEDWCRLADRADPQGISRGDMAGRLLRAALRLGLGGTE